MAWGKLARPAAIAALAAIFMASTPALGEDSVDGRLKSALDRFAAAEYEASLEVLRPLAAERPDDARALFLGGASLNRLARHRAALFWLTKAGAIGRPAFPSLDFELGWAALEEEMWPLAIAHLSRFTAANPDDGKARELLGRAYFGDGQLDLAEESLAATLHADPALHATVTYYLAAIANARGEREQANALLDELLRNEPASPLGKRLAREWAVPGAPAPVTKPWNAVVTMGVGYNDNVLLVNDSGLTLPSDVTTSQSQSVVGAIDAHYTFSGYGQDVVRLGYGGRVARYFDVSQGDLADHALFGVYAHPFRPDLEGAVRAGVSRTFVGGSGLRRSVDLATSMSWRARDWATIEATLARSDFAFDREQANPARERDSTQLSGAINVYIVPPRTVWKIRPRFGYARIDNDADGGDYDFHADSFFVAVNFTPAFDTTFDLVVSATNANYENPNSFASDGVSLFAFERKDRARAITLNVTRPIFEDVDAFGTVAYRKNASNIGLFEYRQHQYVAGVRVRF